LNKQGIAIKDLKNDKQLLDKKDEGNENYYIITRSYGKWENNVSEKVRTKRNPDYIRKSVSNCPKEESNAVRYWYKRRIYRKSEAFY
jgi:hypothetical protein